jgi:predicted MFS family arabinose efflux permease
VPFLFTIFTAPFSGLPGIVYAMSVAAFVNAVGRMGMLFVALYLAEVQHYGAGSIGWLVAAAGLGSVTGAYASGVLSDRLPPAHVLVAALALTAASFALLILAAGPWMIAPILFLVGLGEGGFRPSYNRIVMAQPRGLGARPLGLSDGCQSCIRGGGADRGLLASVDYVLVFATDGLTSILAAGLMLWMFGSRSRLGRRTAEHPLAHETILVAKRSPYKDLVFGALCLSLLLSSLVLDQVKSTYPLYLNEVYRLEPEEIGSLYLINGLMVVAMQVPLTWLLKHVASQTTAWAGTLLLCGGFAVLPFGSSFSLAILSLAIWTLGEILLYPPLIAIVMRRAEQGRSGEYLGIYHGASSLALLLGPAIGGTIYAVWSPATLWFGCGVIGILAAMLIAIPESRLSWAAGRTRVGAPD